MRTGLRDLLRDRRGTAAIEFALASVFLFVILMVALDFAYYQQQKLRLSNAVQQGAMIAFNARANAPTVDTAALTTFITAAAGGAPATDYRCNGSSSCTSAAPASKCIGAPATATSWPTVTDASSGTSCASGAAAGYYLVIRASKAFQPLVVPGRFVSTNIVQQAVVRLQ